MTRHPESLDDAKERVRRYDAVASELGKVGNFQSLDDKGKRQAVDNAIRKVYGADVDVNAVRAEVASAANDMARVQAGENIRKLKDMSGTDKYFQSSQGNRNTPYQRVATDRNMLVHPEMYDVTSAEEMDKNLYAARARAEELLKGGKQSREVNKLLRGFIDAVDKLNPLSPDDIGPEAFRKGADYNATISRDFMPTRTHGENERIRKRGEEAAHNHLGRAAGVLRSLGLVGTVIGAAGLAEDVLNARDEINHLAELELVPPEAIEEYTAIVAVSKLEQSSTMGLSKTFGYHRFSTWAEKYDIDPGLLERLDPSGVTTELKYRSMASLEADTAKAVAEQQTAAASQHEPIASPTTMAMASTGLDAQIRELSRALAGITVADRPAPYMENEGQATHRVPQSQTRTV